MRDNISICQPAQRVDGAHAVQITAKCLIDSRIDVLGRHGIRIAPDFN